jgi:hypothetical protein
VKFLRVTNNGRPNHSLYDDGMEEEEEEDEVGIQEIFFN